MKTINELKQDLVYFQYALKSTFYWIAKIKRHPRDMFYRRQLKLHHTYCKRLLAGSLELNCRKVGGRI